MLPPRCSGGKDMEKASGHEIERIPDKRGREVDPPSMGSRAAKESLFDAFAVEGRGPHGWGAPPHAAVLEATAVGRGTTLLDLGCGTGLFARAAIDRGARVTGIDLDPAAVARATAE